MPPTNRELIQGLDRASAPGEVGSVPNHGTGSATWAPAALSGKLFKAVGEVIFDGVEYGIIRRRMSSIKKKLRREPTMFLYPNRHMPEDLWGISRDLREMARDVYPLAIKELAIAMVFYIDVCYSLACLRDSLDPLLVTPGYLEDEGTIKAVFRALDEIVEIRWHPDIRSMAQGILRDLRYLSRQKPVYGHMDRLWRKPFQGDLFDRYQLARDQLVCNDSLTTGLRKLYRARFRFPDRFLEPQ